MYAIVETGGKQYKVAPGNLVRVETIDKKRGEDFELEKVLFYENDGKYQVGKPYIEGARVISEIVEHGKAKKVHIFKYKAKKAYSRRAGHRQNYTQLRIKEIKVN